MGHLPEALVGDAHHGHLGHVGMAEHEVLDLGWVGVEPAHDEHVLLAVGDVDVPALVHHPDVARVQPPVGVDRRLGLLRLVQVALHHVVAPDHDLARLSPQDLHPVFVDDQDLDVVDGPTGRGRDGLRVVVVAAHGRDAGGLGQSVAGHHGLEAEDVVHLVHQLHRNRGRP